MRKKVLSALLTATMVISAFSGMSTTAFASTIDPAALEKMGNDLDKLTDSFNGLDLTNPPAEETKVSTDNTEIQTNMMIAASNTYTLGLQKNGRVVSCGLNLSGADSVSDWRSITMISAGFNHSVGLKNDGTVVAAGSNADGECNVSEWKDIVSISAGLSSTVGLKKDGTVVGTGSNVFGELDFSTWKNIVAIAAGADHTVGLKSDGTVLAIGKNCGTVLNTSSWHDIVSISASSNDIMGLDKNGKVYSTYANKVSNFTDVVAIATAEMYAVGLKKDGTVITSADDVDVSGWKNIIAIAAGTSHVVGLKSDGTVVAAEIKEAFQSGETNVGNWQLNVSKTQPVAVAPTTPTVAVTAASNASTATPTASKVLVDGFEKAFDAYTISGSNYFKLRDLAFILNGTVKQVDVTWDASKNAINLLSNKPYSIAGGEMIPGNGKSKNATVSTAKIYLDGKVTSLTAYSINGNNYFKLRDVMQLLNVNVGWDGAKNTITLDTTKGY